MLSINSCKLECSSTLERDGASFCLTEGRIDSSSRVSRRQMSGIRLPSHIDASTLFNCSSGHKAPDTLAPGSNTFFRFAHFLAELAASSAVPGGVLSCRVSSVAETTGSFSLRPPPIRGVRMPWKETRGEQKKKGKKSI